MTVTIPTANQTASAPLRQWYPATWVEYIALRDAPLPERMKLATLVD